VRCRNGGATLDALQALPEIGVEAPIGYAGVTLGVVTGLMLDGGRIPACCRELGGFSCTTL